MGLSEKIRFEIAVSEEYVETTVQALSEGGRTGEVGDGKIFSALTGLGGAGPHRRNRRRRRHPGRKLRWHP